MEEARNQTIFLSVIAVATLLVAIIGATFAWFSIGVTGNEETKNIVYTTASLGAVTFTDGASIDVSGIMPGDKNTKKFTVAQTDPAATNTIVYNIKLNINSNTLTPNANGYFVHSIVGDGNTNGGTLVNLEEAEVPTESIIIGTGILDGYETHEYEYSIGLNYADEDQNAAQGKEFSGYITVEIADESKYPTK